MELHLMIPEGPEDWIETYSGRQFRFLSPTPEDIDVVADVVVPLSRDCRYGGHCQRFLSVAEHSCHLAHWVYSASNGSRRLALQALLHDASEAYLRDIPRPIKRKLGAEYLEIESRIMAAVMDKHGLSRELHPLVKEADSRILVDERAQNMLETDHQWSTDGLEPLNVQLRFWDPPTAGDMFLTLYRELWRL